MNFVKAFSVAALTSLHVFAQASLIQPDEYEAGSLTWLKLSETVGLSMNDFRSGAGGWNSKYRLASSIEIGRLLQSFGVAEGNTGLMVGAPGAGEFIFTIGGTAPDGIYSGTWGFNGNQGADGVGQGWFVSAYLHGEAPVQIEQCPPYFSCSRISAIRGTQPNYRSSIAGLFLVKDDTPRGVPEPGSLALLGLAGGLLGYQRRKVRK